MIMTTTLLKENILKSRILFLIFTVFILSAIFFTSCSDSEDLYGADDTTLILKIENATKTTVRVASLPLAAVDAFNTDLLDSFIEQAEWAEGLGFKVSIATDNAAREEEKAKVFFNLEGRQLIDNRSKFKKGRNKCFEFVFPIDFIMPDSTFVVLMKKADWILIRDWYKANPKAAKRAKIVFPLEVTLEDGTVQTLLDINDLKEVKDACKKGKDKRKCFKLVLPVSYTMPDASIITVAEKVDFRLVRAWYKENTNIKERGVLNYPLEIISKEGNTVLINNESELKAAREACRD
jgi:hypothetical protein